MDSPALHGANGDQQLTYTSLTNNSAVHMSPTLLPLPSQRPETGVGAENGYSVGMMVHGGVGGWESGLAGTELER